MRRMAIGVILSLIVASVSAESPYRKKDHRYHVKLRVERTDDANFLIDARVTDLVTGAVVAEPRLTTAPAAKTRTTVNHVDTFFFFTAIGHDDGSARVTMRALRNGRPVDALVVEYLPRGVALRRLGERCVSLKFENADVREALKKLADLTGWDIAVTRRVNRTITIDLQNVSAAEAFETLIKQAGLYYALDDNTIRVMK